MIKCKWIALIAPLLVALAAAPAAGQSFPNKPIRLVLPYAPGGATDFIGRTVAQHLGEVIGQQVVAENKTGSGGIPGTDFVVRSAPDGYTLVLMDPAIVINPSLLASVPFDLFKDLKIVSRVSSAALVLVASPHLPVKTFAEFLAHGKANPGKLNFCLRRHRHDAASRRRIAQAARGRRCRARALSRHRPVLHRHDERQDLVRVFELRGRAAVHRR